MLHKISSSEAYRAVYKALHEIFIGLSLVILSEIQKSEYSALDAAIEAVQRFWAGILCNHQGLTNSYITIRKSPFIFSISKWIFTAATSNKHQLHIGYWKNRANSRQETD